MKLFDFLQDCVAAGAVLFLIVNMSGQDDPAYATGPLPRASGYASGPQTLPPSATDLRYGEAGLLPSNRGPAARELQDSLDALDRELDAILSDPSGPSGGNGFGDGRGVGQVKRTPIAPLTLPPPGQEPGELGDVIRHAMPMPDAGDYNLDQDRPLLDDTMPWETTRVPMQPTGSSAKSRQYGAAPSASRPLMPRRVETLPPPAAEESGLEEFGASLDRQASRRGRSRIAAPPSPRRVR